MTKLARSGAQVLVRSMETTPLIAVDNPSQVDLYGRTEIGLPLSSDWPVASLKFSAGIAG